MTRAMPPDEMERTLRPAFEGMRACGAPIVHYKVCSTFDSSPTVGSIGRAIEVGMDVFGGGGGVGAVPVVVGAPALGRYCVFGNLFVRNAGDSEPIRIDRHPSMSRHPTTPMAEADLRLHLAKQTSKCIGLIDVVALSCGGAELADTNADVVFIDLLDECHLAAVGRLIAGSPFVVGSSGVEAALMAHWKAERKSFAPVAPAEKILAVCGSCSPVSSGQIDWALGHGFADVRFESPNARGEAICALRNRRSVVIHTRGGGRPAGDALGATVRDVLESTGVRRVLVAGGDTSGQVARALGIESLEMIGELTRGSPLCRAVAPRSPADGVEFTFKGGQIGPVDFFGMVEKGTARG
jgi:uncharacterized protein YgbK (DUF1537 family)